MQPDGATTQGAGFRKPTPEATAALLAQLQARFGERFSAAAALRAQHANTVTGAASQPAASAARLPPRLKVGNQAARATPICWSAAAARRSAR